MKKSFAILMLAGMALMACTKEIPVAEKAAQPLEFNITVTHPDGAATKAVKTGWEDGDVVYVFFSEAEAPKYLEMKYDGETESWTNTQKNGTDEEAFDLTEGTMTAVFLPFGSDAEVGADDDGNFVFNKMYYSYFLKAEQQDYTVEDGVVYGKLNMLLPDGFVQFFMESSAASPAMAALIDLWEDHLAPAGVKSIAADGTVNMKVRNYGGAMPAYYYDNGTDPKGLHFSGILKESARGVATEYAFHGNVRVAQYHITASTVLTGTKTLYTATSRAMKLPMEEGWEEEPHTAVDLGLDVKWATMNVGAASPFEYGDYFAWGETEPYYSSLDPLTWKDGKKDYGYLWGSYFDTEDEGNSFTNYATDKKTVLDPADDAATANWGEPWRMPTMEELEALFDEDNFDWEWIENSSFAGRLITSKIPGYEGRQILLLAAGLRTGKDSSDLGSYGFIWSSNLNGGSSTNASYVSFNVERMNPVNYSRYLGLSVRP
ncbi:MAG: hypothetical protein IKX62_02850, partial [Bacteroidales bacterium]|nr:hypothetical protein [Bacteroidales bacterium]